MESLALLLEVGGVLEWGWEAVGMEEGIEIWLLTSSGLILQSPPG